MSQISLVNELSYSNKFLKVKSQKNCYRNSDSHYFLQSRFGIMEGLDVQLKTQIEEFLLWFSRLRT